MLPLSKRVSLILLLSALLLLAFGCSSDDDGTGPSDSIIPASMTGTWLYEALIEDGVFTPMNGANTLVLESTGDFQVTVNAEVYASGTATIADGHLLLSIVECTDESEIDSTWDDLLAAHSTYMTLDDTTDGASERYVLVRDHDGNNSLIGLVYANSTMEVQAGASVELIYGENTPITETTDQYGMFYREAADTGEVTLITMLTGFQENNRVETIVENSTSFVAIGLAEAITGPTGTITGTVTDGATSSPMSGVTVETESGVSTTTNSSGVYTMTAAAGEQVVTASKTGYTSATETVTVAENASVTADFALNEIVVGAYGTITGTVTNQFTSAPIANIILFTDAAVEGGVIDMTTTGADGSFTLLATPGERTIYAADTSLSYEYSTQELTVVDGQNYTLNIQMQPTTGSNTGTIAGVVTDASNGNPLEGVQLSSDQGGVTTDATGHYSIESSVGSAQFLSAYKVGYVTVQGYDVVVEFGQTTTRDIAMTPEAAPETFQVYGHVRTNDGYSPLAGVTVTSDDGYSDVTDNGGIYQFQVGVGSRTLTYTKLAYTTATMTVFSNTAGGSVVVDDVNMEPDQSMAVIHGAVRNATTNEGIAGAFVYSVTGGYQAYTSSTGSYTLQVSPGQDNILVTADGFADLNQNVAVSVGQNLLVHFDLTPEGGGDNCTISGVVHTPNGINTIPHAKVSVSSSQYVYTDHDGNYTLVVPAPDTGYYEVTATHLAFLASSNNVDAYPGGTSDFSPSMSSNDQVSYLYGTIVDGNGNPLAGVSFEGDGISGNGLSDGTFALQPLMFHGNITAYKDGYSDDTVNYTISFGQSLRVDFVLQQNR